MLAPSYLAAVVGILAVFFPDISVEALGTTVNTLTIIGSFIFVGIRQLISGRSTLLGGRPEYFVE